jgi:hypothetical protein
MGMHTVEPLVPGPSRLEVEIAIPKLKSYKSPDSDQIPGELIQAGGEKLLSAIHKLINSVWNKEELPDQWKESVIVPIHKNGDKLTVIIIMGYHCYQLHTKDEMDGACSTNGGEEERVYVISGKVRRKETTGKTKTSRYRWVDNIEMDLRKMECGGVDWIGLVQDRDKWRALVSAVMNVRVP